MQALDLKIPTILIVILLPSRDIFVDGTPKHFDYYTLAMQWPGTVCKLEPANCPNFWTIHGLWPSVSAGDDPVNCEGQLSSKSIAQDTKKELNSLWPDLIHGNNFAFWKGQWRKHGSCAADLFNYNANEYFRKAIELAKRYNIKKIFDDNKMDANSQLKIGTIRDAIYAATQHHSKVVPCKGKVREIRICYDKNTFNVIDCNGNQQQQLLQQPQPLIQDNEEQCPIFSNGQTQISFIAPVLQMILIPLFQQLIF